ncbi:PTS fructose transporter subunit IIABC [Pontibacillus sp. HMF3514]|uniref:PTS fructose transporter subunit IIABC n=1 Tax=Pontibacillus sp. HMF3514 TaxID=2692425 RepID=UPI0013201935|nr:PTS fructose transporter subunit IIABC [Pontibacillus sp. HMF3514]QHE51568.1 PTS transporter subunit EIIA [Pontibacillus sp. HMF3514]
MKITDLLKKDTIALDLDARSKSDVIDGLVNKLDQAGRLNNASEFKKAIEEREEQSSTGIGEGIAIPHAKTSAVNEPAIAFGRTPSGVDYNSLDGQPANLFFMIAASEGANQTHLDTLSKLSTLLMDEGFRKELEQARTEDDVIEAINRKEQEEHEDDTPEDSDQFIIGVTGCPTGIAHTYMAADKLKEAAKEKGVGIKVETNGSGGVKNIPTKEEIEKADAIIVASDVDVEMDRFQGKPVIQTTVGKGIHESTSLIERAMKKDAPIYQGRGQSSSEDSGGGEERTGFYKHLMNGVSNMLPLVVGGGILIAISFIFGIKAANPDHESHNIFAEWLMNIGGGTAFALMIPVLAGFIAQSIAGRPGLAPGLVGGMLASSGGSGFLGGLIAGFLAGYLVEGIKKMFGGLPQSLEGLKPVLIYPLLGIFSTGLIMILINSPLSAIMDGLTGWLEGLGETNLILVGLVLGGMMAVDMGGPINKAAYTFGLAMIDAENYAPIAAIMAGGMTPPLGLAIATTMFKSKFTKQEQEAGKTAYVMGASFITEGAIPFAAADPARVIPSIITGSALAGALTMLFGITLRAPHGGVFVAGLVNGNVPLAPLFYLLAILAGAFVTAIMVGSLKKKIQ